MMNDDVPMRRTIKIGRASVGLVGLDMAINKITNNKSLSEDETVDLLFAAVSKHNYIPQRAENTYKEALRKEIRRRSGVETPEEKELVVRVLGPGCVSCNRLTSMLIEVLDKLHLAADMESVQDLDEIWRYGVLNTPALVINNMVKCSGRMPTLAQVEKWIREASAS